MTTRPQIKLRTSGFCNPSLPRTKAYDPHQRCPGCDCTADGCPCAPTPIIERAQRPDVGPDQDLINAATVITRIAGRPNRHPDTAAILLPIAADLRQRAWAARQVSA